MHVGSSHAGAAPATRVPAALRRDSARGRRRRIPSAPRYTLCLQPILPVSIQPRSSQLLIQIAILGVPESHDTK